MIRALEVHQATGQPLSAYQVEHDQPAPASVAVFALERPRDVLVERIDRRVVQMFDEGLVDEVERLRANPQPMSLVASQAVGYAEVMALLDGAINQATAIQQIQLRTRQFAKRQMTWFRNLAEVQRWGVDNDEPAETTAQKLMDELNRRNVV